jgi:site-specific recombinase XerD
MQPVRVAHKLLVVLSCSEVARLIAAAPNLKHQTALSIAYGAGLRHRLKVGDVDSQRMILRIEQGKGRKDRYAMLASALERLRAWWRVAHAQGRMLPGGWLFPTQPDGRSPRASQPRHPRRRRAAQIDKRVRCTRCATALRPICSSRRSTSA